MLVTAVYHARQAPLADAVGAVWTALPTPGAWTPLAATGREEVLRMQALLRGTGTRVLVASIRDADQATDFAASAGASTVGTEVAEQLLHELLTDAAVAEFARAAAALA